MPGVCLGSIRHVPGTYWHVPGTYWQAPGTYWQAPIDILENLPWVAETRKCLSSMGWFMHRRLLV